MFANMASGGEPDDAQMMNMFKGLLGGLGGEDGENAGGEI
jgi:hypothetical protein